MIYEVGKAIKKLKNNKSTGLDDIPAEVIKAVDPEVVHKIHKMCSDIWRTGKWPKD